MVANGACILLFCARCCSCAVVGGVWRLTCCCCKLIILLSDMLSCIFFRWVRSPMQMQAQVMFAAWLMLRLSWPPLELTV